MKAIEFEAEIDAQGNAHVPDRYRKLYGRQARFLVLLPDSEQEDGQGIDPMQYSNTLDWPIDGLEYQRQARSEWE